MRRFICLAAILIVILAVSGCGRTPQQQAEAVQQAVARAVAEERLADIFTLFSGLAIFIASLGLLGLASHTAQRRTREIGVRKVLGATVARILVMLTKDFARLVLLAALVATPIAYLLSQYWLEGFAYRVELGPVVFLVTCGVALVVAVATVGYQAFRAARSNPVDAIRYE